MKPLGKQVLFITGASSGIGLAIARLAVERGAKVFLVSRNEEALRLITDDLNLLRSAADYAVADVGDYDELQKAVEKCLKGFGRIDTFINNAGTTIYDKIMDTSIAEARKLFETNFWGVVNGCLLAVPLMREQGGTVINIGSNFSTFSFALQGFYSATKFAIKAYTDALRRELTAENIPVNISFVMPSGVNTPLIDHVRSKLRIPSYIPFVYSVQFVAHSILKCAEKPVRQLTIGAPAWFLPLLDKLFKLMMDQIMGIIVRVEMRKSSPSGPRPGNLFRPLHDEGRESSSFEGHIFKSSVSSKFSEKVNSVKDGTGIAPP